MFRRRSRKASTSQLSPSTAAVHMANDHPPAQRGPVVEEIRDLIKVYKDGHVERPHLIPIAPSSELAAVASIDFVIHKPTNLWVRLYVPSAGCALGSRLPLLVYFHGGGFCLGSVAWSCYHTFLDTLASKARCIIVSVNYRLAPENRLPAAYDDGFAVLTWLKQQLMGQNGNSSHHHGWWLNRVDPSSLFLAGDSAGGNIAYNVAVRVGSGSAPTFLWPLGLKGLILIQPFFGGEARTGSEMNGPGEVSELGLSLSASDTYWRLALPTGAGREHPWCNPLGRGAPRMGDFRLPATMVCVSEMDILKDRNLEFSSALAGAGEKIETQVYKGVGHAFQILHSSQLSQSRRHELMTHLKDFINYQD
ncbi:probable carboxylesterase 17 [Malania oleifera]|uniref:probable carboxylesterase 17 n=1 Tax=Malania oleifera TaxID=397392 RepID=UPI0025AE60AD|nr:probable carboxylesterase 17 [Malania oleifera]